MGQISGIDPCDGACSGADLHGTEHGEEALANDEGEEEVDSHGQALACGAGLQWLDLTRHQPAQRTPRPPYNNPPQLFQLPQLLQHCLCPTPK